MVSQHGVTNGWGDADRVSLLLRFIPTFQTRKLHVSCYICFCHFAVFVYFSVVNHKLELNRKININEMKTNMKWNFMLLRPDLPHLAFQISHVALGRLANALSTHSTKQETHSSCQCLVSQRCAARKTLLLFSWPSTMRRNRQMRTKRRKTGRRATLSWLKATKSAASRQSAVGHRATRSWLKATTKQRQRRRILRWVALCEERDVRFEVVCVLLSCRTSLYKCMSVINTLRNVPICRLAKLAVLKKKTNLPKWVTLGTMLRGVLL